MTSRYRRLDPLVEPLRRTLEQLSSPWIVLCVLAACALVIGFWLTRPVSTAEFRLTARSERVGLQLGSSVTLAIRATNWSINDIASIDLKGRDALRGTGMSLSLAPGPARPALDSAAVQETRIIVHMPGGQLTAERHRDSNTRFQLGATSPATEIDLQLPSPDSSLLFDDGEGNASRLTEVGTVILGDDAANSIDFGIAGDVAPLGDGFRVTAIGFGRLRTAVPGSPVSDDPGSPYAGHELSAHDLSRAPKRIQPGMIEGRLQFVDLSASESLQLFRGTDIRFSGVDAIVDALMLTRDSIDINVSGTATDIRLHIGDAKGRSVMPTEFDRLRNSPAASVFVGTVSAFIALLGILFTAASVIRRLGNWLDPERRRK